ncbi:hypothetical protein [Acidithiobacillus ferrooxidans]|uniref:hypothetical protein n=1 Tax=Acidithiobacillus ferrooxidans TaxID=920 RepID=UPI001D031F26|nr:hypothetical protein [Acidithiobacillus ferrooxidans]
MNRTREILVATFMMVATSLPLTAQAANTGILARVLASHHAGKIIRTFPGPDGLTGVVMTYNGSKAIAYLTPNGKYLISGLVLNLATGMNVTAGYGVKYIGKVNLVKGAAAAKIAYQCANLSGIVVGNKAAANVMIAVFNPSTPNGRQVMAAMMGEAGQMAKKGTLKVLALRMVPYGPLAPAILSAGNAGREQRLLAVLKNQSPGYVTDMGTRFAQRNQVVLGNIPMKPPFLVILFPQSGISAAIPVRNLMRVESTVKSAEILAGRAQ